MLFQLFDNSLTNTLHYQIFYKPRTTLNGIAGELDTAFRWFSFQLILNFQAGSNFCDKRLLASPCASVSMAVRKEQFCSHWAVFREILYCGFLL